MKEQLALNLEEINNNISQANKNNQNVLMVAVTKSVDADVIKQLYDLGLRDFGENRVQAFKDKRALLPSDINWHFIGNLQRNKVKDVIGRALIHSVSSIPLIIKINKRSYSKGIVQDVLLEINIANETSKHGFEPEQIYDIIAEIEALELKNVKIKGLMCMAPFTKEIETVRPYFELLKSISKKLSETSLIYEPKYLSMGMTNDYEIAIEEGANTIRIGTALFKSSNSK